MILSRIETNIPLPGKYYDDVPFGELEVGHSYFLKGATKNVMAQKLFKWRLDNDRKLLKKFVIKEFEGGTRIWRRK